MMRKILLLLENELLAQLYKTNLSVYLEAQISYCRNYTSFKAISGNLNDFSLIVSQAQMDNVNLRKEFESSVAHHKLETPVILVGEPETGGDSNAIIPVADYFNIPSLLSTAARRLSITAQMMASYKVPDFYPIDIEFIYYLHKAPTSLYLLLEDEYVLFAAKGTTIDDVAKNLKAEGVSKFYIKANERLEVVKKITEILKEDLMQNAKLTTVQKTEILSSGFDFFVNNFVSPQASQEIVHMASVCSRVMADVASEIPDMQSMFASFAKNKNSFVYVHTMLGSYVATHIVRNVTWGGESQVEKMNMVFFFHDIYLAPICAKYPHLMSEEDILNSPDLSRFERHTVLNHARLASELVAGYKRAPIGCDQLIKQHHGMNSGIGFAEEFKDDISPMAKILIVSEAFVDYFIRYKEMNPTKPLDIVEAIQFLNEKFKKNSYKKIVEILLSLRI